MVPETDIVTKVCQESEVLVRDLEVLMPQSWLGRTHGLVSGNVIVIGFLCSSIRAPPSDGTGALRPGPAGRAQRWWRAGKFLTLSVWHGSLQAISEALRAHPAGVWDTHALPGQGGAVHPAAQAGLLMPCVTMLETNL